MEFLITQVSMAVIPPYIIDSLTATQHCKVGIYFVVYRTLYYAIDITINHSSGINDFVNAVT